MPYLRRSEIENTTAWKNGGIASLSYDIIGKQCDTNKTNISDNPVFAVPPRLSPPLKHKPGRTFTLKTPVKRRNKLTNVGG